MSKPSFSNIDLWLFELAEGNLSSEQIAQLELFLLQNPELDVDKDMWQMAKVNADPVIYTDVASLERRKPVGLYSSIGATLFILLTFVGCYQYFGIDASQNQLNGKANGIAQTNGKSSSEQQLMDEIANLKEELRDLKSENRSLLSSVNHLEKQRNSQKASSVGKDGDAINVIGNQNGAITANNGSINNSAQIGLFASNQLDPNATSTSFYQNNGLAMNQQNDDVEFINHESKYGNVRTYPVRTIDYDWYSGRGPFAVNNGSHSKSSESAEIKLGFKSKMNKMARSIQRMMDNPVALKNSRDPHYHIPGMTSQDVNMGATGTLLRPRVQTLSRIQWLGTEQEQLMNQLSVDGYAYGIRGGIGIQMNHSMYHNGGIQVADVALTYSPKFSVSKWVSVEPALRFKMGSKMLNHSAMDGVTAVEMERGNVFDYQSPIGTNLWYKDLGLGLMVNTKWFFVGVQGDNLLKHYDNIYSADISSPRRAGTHFVATIGTDWESRKENMSLSPYMVYQQKEQLSEAWLGFNYRWGVFNVGGAISSKMDPAASIGLKFKSFSINYNADYTRSLITNEQSLSHQVSLRFLGKTSRSGQRLLNL